MVRKACQRAIDENVVDLQRSYENLEPRLHFDSRTSYLLILVKGRRNS